MKKKRDDKISRRVNEGALVTLDEQSYPDWEARLRRAKREARSGKAIEFEAFLRAQKKRRRDQRQSCDLGAYYLALVTSCPFEHSRQYGHMPSLRCLSQI